jgi:hypothetical protein
MSDARNRRGVGNTLLDRADYSIDGPVRRAHQHAKFGPLPGDRCVSGDLPPLA